MSVKTALFCKQGKPGVAEAIAYAQEKLGDVTVYCGAMDEPFPVPPGSGYECVISYISPWIIPEYLLRSARLAINFHPGPPEYPGIGCFNFALNDNVLEYGITCHHMLKKVDTGSIIAVERFLVAADESVYSLSIKSYAYMQKLYVDIVDRLAQGSPLPESAESWRRKPYTRKELEDLCRIEWGEPFETVERRIHAVSYPNMPGAYFTMNGRAYSVQRDKKRDRR